MVNAAEKKVNLSETEIIVVLDRSGSMESIEKETVAGFNTFLKEQQNAEGGAFITLVQFDDRYELNYKSIPVKTANPLILRETYQPRGSTALYDAIGKTILDLQTTRDVVFVIITDGQENASQNYTSSAIQEKIESLKRQGWKFVFLAANQDAIMVGESIGVHRASSMTFEADSVRTKSMFSSFSHNVSAYRSARERASQNLNDDQELGSEIGSENLNFTEEQRDEQKDKT